MIAGGREGYDRLKILSRVWGEATESVLREAGVVAGLRCLDVGCGAGDVTFLLAQMVGPTGSVVGIDTDRAELDLVVRECADRDISNVDLEVGDASALAADAEYDVVYSRFLLEHLPEPVEALKRMWRAVRPGGVLVSQDADFEGAFAEPPHPGFDFWRYAYQETLRRNGGDPLCGRRLHALFLAAGIPDPHLSVAQRVDFEGDGKVVFLLTVQRTGPSIVSSGVATQAELDAGLALVSEMVKDTTTAVGSPRLFGCWARKP